MLRITVITFNYKELLEVVVEIPIFLLGFSGTSLKTTTTFSRDILKWQTNSHDGAAHSRKI